MKVETRYFTYSRFLLYILYTEKFWFHDPCYTHKDMIKSIQVHFLSDLLINSSTLDCRCFYQGRTNLRLQFKKKKRKQRINTNFTTVYFKIITYPTSTSVRLENNTCRLFQVCTFAIGVWQTQVTREDFIAHRLHSSSSME